MSAPTGAGPELQLHIDGASRGNPGEADRLANLALDGRARADA